MGFWRNWILKCSIVTLLLGMFFAGGCILLPEKGNAQLPEETKRKAVLILINGTTLDDFSPENTPHIYGLMEKGAVALMNTRSAGSRNIPNSYATIGAGKHVVSSGFGGEAFNTKSELEDFSVEISYIARTGMKPPAEGIVNLGIPQILTANEKENTADGIGMLGEALHAAGLKTGVLGNGDTYDQFNRDAVTIAMDKWGRVDYGNVSRSIVSNVPESALGYQTNYPRLLEEFRELYTRADFIVVETGDTFRAEQLSHTAFPQIMAGEKHSAVARADAFVGELLSTLDLDNTLVMVTSPFPSKQALNGNNYMTPLVLYTGEQVPGFLTSGTTRREGVVANTDIAPTVMSYLGVPIPPGVTGRVLETVPGQNVISTLSEMNEDMAFIYTARPVLVKGYVGVLIVVMVLVIAIMTLWPWFLRYLRPLLVWLMAVPLSLLIVSAVRFVTLPLYTLIAIVIAALIVVGAYTMWHRRDVDLFIIIALATCTAVMVDTLTGSNLIKYSTLGYDPMSGARYYGIGNEYMGVVIGSSIIGVAALWEKHYEKHPRRVEAFTIAFFAVTVFIMGAPYLGTNVGGTIAAIAAFIFTYMRLKGKKINLKQMAAMGSCAALVIFCLAVFDMHRSVEVQSHLGRFANNILSGGWPVIVDMAMRKVNMNITLIRYTIWSRVFLVMLSVLMVSFYRPVGLMQKVRSSYPYIFQGMLGILVGSAVALAVNDSGVVAAATMMIFGIAPLIYLMGREREQRLNALQAPKES
ncbi:MAG: hypothetical protein ACOX2P_08465 [Bacillota bacterium]